MNVPLLDEGKGKKNISFISKIPDKKKRPCDFGILARKQVDGRGKQRDKKRQKPVRSHLTEINWDAQRKRKCAIFRIFSDLYLLHNIKNALLCTGK